MASYIDPELPTRPHIKQHSMASSPTSAPKGIRFNHVAVRVSDLKRSLTFYTEGLGMKELGRFDLDTFTIVPLGFEDTVQDGLLVLQREGVLELVHAKVSDIIQSI